MEVNSRMIGNAIRQTRESKGWTAVRLSNEICVDNSTISKIETGDSKPSIDCLFRIATALNLLPEDLLKKARLLEIEPIPSNRKQRSEIT